MLANITNFVSIKLSSENYHLWKRKFEPLLIINDLYGYIDGSTPCPDQYLKDTSGKITTTVNSSYTTSCKNDQMPVSWLKATFSKQVLAREVNLSTSYDIWNSLAIQFGTRCKSRKAQLRLQLQTLKNGIATVTEYLHKAKAIAHNLSTISYLVDEDDLVLAMVNGLPKDNDARTLRSCHINPGSTNLEQLHGLLLN